MPTWAGAHSRQHPTFPGQRTPLEQAIAALPPYVVDIQEHIDVDVLEETW